MAARGDYFLWAAADDVRSFDYLALNHDFLKNNPAYVASGSPNGFENWGSEVNLVNFSIEENQVFERYIKFFQNCYLSHGLFYCLFRTRIMRESEFLDQIFPGYDWLGMDWATILNLASKGKINRTAEGKLILGTSGVSSGKNIFKIYNHKKIEYIVPFYVLSRYVRNLTKDLSNWQKLRILFVLVKLNTFVVIKPLYEPQKNFLYGMYCRFLKPLVKSF